MAEWSIAAVLKTVEGYTSGGSNPSSSAKNLADARFFISMYSTYILKSEKTGTYYYGHSIDLIKRLKRHNSGFVKSTKSKRPWVVHYKEEFQTKSEAYKRELFFKSIDGYNWLGDNKIF